MERPQNKKFSLSLGHRLSKLYYSLPFWQHTSRKPITHVGSGSHQAVGCWHLDVVLIRAYCNKATRTNLGNISICSPLSLKGQDHLFKRKPQASFPLPDPLQTKHEHQSSPQVASLASFSLPAKHNLNGPACSVSFYPAYTLLLLLLRLSPSVQQSVILPQELYF